VVAVTENMGKPLSVAQHTLTSLSCLIRSFKQQRFSFPVSWFRKTIEACSNHPRDPPECPEGTGA